MNVDCSVGRGQRPCLESLVLYPLPPGPSGSRCSEASLNAPHIDSLAGLRPLLQLKTRSGPPHAEMRQDFISSFSSEKKKVLEHTFLFSSLHTHSHTHTSIHILHTHTHTYTLASGPLYVPCPPPGALSSDTLSQIC